MLLVTGANGFIGRSVCAAATRSGLDVVGLSRGGAPAPVPKDLERVRWFRGDAFDAVALKSALHGVTAIAHCIGIARERPSKRETWSRVNGDAAIAVGEAALSAGVKSFVFVSAAEKPPWAHEEYLSSKRRAEHALAKLDLRLVVVRPGLVYGDERPASRVAALALKAAQTFGVGMPLVRANAPLPVDALARAIVRAVLDERLRGTLEGASLTELGAQVLTA